MNSESNSFKREETLNVLQETLIFYKPFNKSTNFRDVTVIFNNIASISKSYVKSLADKFIQI